MINPKTNERELAYVVAIDDVHPIEGKDRVECAVVGGWQVMVRKGLYKKGDLAVYFEIDSLVPNDKECFAFLEKYKYKVKTQKFKNFYSQGLLMSAEELGGRISSSGQFAGNIPLIILNEQPYQQGDFLTEVLNVKYYNAEDRARKASSKNQPINKYKKMAKHHPKVFQNPIIRIIYKTNIGKKLLYVFFGGVDKKCDTSFPTQFPFVKKSDEERIENIPFKLQNKTPYIKTTKIDGTSSLYILERKRFRKPEFYVCSRNVRQLTPEQTTYFLENVYWSVAHKYHIQNFLEEMLKIHPEWDYVALQGETAGIGEDGGKIQGNPHNFKELRFFGYNFIDSIHGRWNSIEAKKLVEPYGIEWVPIVDENYILPDTMEEFKLSADGPCEAPGASGPREGYVYRSTLDPNDSFKNVSRVYLMKHS